MKRRQEQFNQSRIPELDFIRGIALMGIIFVNISGFALPGDAFMNPHTWPISNGSDFLAFQTVYLFVQNKFYGIFSLLFGIGIAIQYDRYTKGTGRRPRAIILKRHLLLFVIGFLHIFIWYGDIIHWYAIAGTTTLFFLGKPPFLRLIMAGLSLLIAWTLLTLTLLAILSFPLESYEDQLTAAEKTLVISSLEGSTETYEGDKVQELLNHSQWGGITLQFKAMKHGPALNYIRVQIDRYKEIIWGFFSNLLWIVLFYMLIGSYLCSEKHLIRVLDTPIGTWDFLVGAAGLTITMVGAYYLKTEAIQDRFLSFTLGQLGSFFLVYFYVRSLARLYQKKVLLPLTESIGCLGRLSLTNYLLQSLMLGFLFHFWGLGRFGEFGYLKLYLIGSSVICLQIVLSNMYLSRWRSGPFEWLVRFLSGRMRSPS